MTSATTNIESVLHEERVFPPPPEFAAQAHVKSLGELEALRREASDAPEAFWARMAGAELHWFRKWDTVLKWEAPHAEWFVGGKINASQKPRRRPQSTFSPDLRNGMRPREAGSAGILPAMSAKRESTKRRHSSVE